MNLTDIHIFAFKELKGFKEEAIEKTRMFFGYIRIL